MLRTDDTLGQGHIISLCFPMVDASAVHPTCIFVTLEKILFFLTKSSIGKLIYAIISSRFNHHNSLLYGLQRYLNERLQWIQNTAALILTLFGNTFIFNLCSLSWIPVPFCIKYKGLLITFKRPHHNICATGKSYTSHLSHSGLPKSGCSIGGSQGQNRMATEPLKTVALN